jgi:hypothetical protein
MQEWSRSTKRSQSKCQKELPANDPQCREGTQKFLDTTSRMKIKSTSLTKKSTAANIEVVSLLIDSSSMIVLDTLN